MLDQVAANPILDVLRTIFSFIDRLVFWGIDIVYNIFFSVVQYDSFFPGETFQRLFDRVFLILGFFMLFRLTFSLLSAIVNPENLTNKDKGMGKIVTRVLTVIAMLIVLMPLDIPNPSTQFEESLNEHGFLFGTLYTLQNMVLEQDILGKLILNHQTEGSQADTENQIKNAGATLAHDVYRAFLYPNPECTQVQRLEVWQEGTIGDMIDNINLQCGDSKLYSYSYIPLVSTAAGAMLLFVIIGFTLDVGIRAIKLLVLRLIAPIPVISYIDPKSSKDGAFSAWVKTLASTFLDIFIRLIIIYFVLFLVSEVLKQFPVWGEGTTDNFFMDAIVFVIIIIALFFFAKQAPKFIKDMLGIKGSSGGLGVGLSGILGGFGMLLGGGGFSGFMLGMTQGATMANDAIVQGKAAPNAYSTMRDQMAKIKTGDKDAHGGFMGKIQDRLTYSVREKQAEKYGIGGKDFAKASYTKKLLNSELATATENYELAKAGLEAAGISSAPVMAHYKAPNGIDWISPEKEQQYYRDMALWNRYQEASNKYSVLQKAAKDASDDAARIDKERQAMGLSPRIIDIEHEYLTEAGKYRVPYKVRTNKATGVALDKNDQPTNDPKQYTYTRDPKNYQGAVDETTYINRTSGPGPGHRH